MAACPDTKWGETFQDCPWAGVARTLIAEAQAGHNIVPLMKPLLPAPHELTLQEFWGDSINYDELARSVVVAPAIVGGLEEIFGVKGTPRQSFLMPGTADKWIVHAGVEHTYGYLFSLIKTPYGFKRARWVEGEVAKGFRLPEGILGPKPDTGNLFNNVTYFAGNTAFRDDSDGSKKSLAELVKHKAYISKTLLNFDFTQLKVTRLVEKVSVTSSKGVTRDVILRTDLVAFVVPQKDSHFLVYSVCDPATSQPKLITAFPVAADFVHRTLNPKDLGSNLSITTRYNAYVDGLSGSVKKGTRSVANEK